MALLLKFITGCIALYISVNQRFKLLLGGKKTN